MDAPLTQQELIRPWRRATIVASAVAAAELVLLIAAGGLLLAKPLARSVQNHAESEAFAPAPRAAHVEPAAPKTIAAGLPRLAREETGVLVLNGNGRAGAAAAEAAKLHRLGYVVPATGNAPRDDYATTVIMFRRGRKAEALRLARDLHVKAVGPLDGISAGELRGGHLAVVLGAA